METMVHGPTFDMFYFVMFRKDLNIEPVNLPAGFLSQVNPTVPV